MYVHNHALVVILSVVLASLSPQNSFCNNLNNLQTLKNVSNFDLCMVLNKCFPSASKKPPKNNKKATNQPRIKRKSALGYPPANSQMPSIKHEFYKYRHNYTMSFFHIKQPCRCRGTVPGLCTIILNQDILQLHHFHHLIILKKKIREVSQLLYF